MADKDGYAHPLSKDADDRTLAYIRFFSGYSLNNRQTHYVDI